MDISVLARACFQLRRPPARTVDPTGLSLPRIRTWLVLGVLALLDRGLVRGQLGRREKEHAQQEAEAEARVSRHNPAQTLIRHTATASKNKGAVIHGEEAGNSPCNSQRSQNSRSKQLGHTTQIDLLLAVSIHCQEGAQADCHEKSLRI